MSRSVCTHHKRKMNEHNEVPKYLQNSTRQRKEAKVQEEKDLVSAKQITCFLHTTGSHANMISESFLELEKAAQVYDD